MSTITLTSSISWNVRGPVSILYSHWMCSCQAVRSLFITSCPASSGTTCAIVRMFLWLRLSQSSVAPRPYQWKHTQIRWPHSSFKDAGTWQHNNKLLWSFFFSFNNADHIDLLSLYALELWLSLVSHFHYATRHQNRVTNSWEKQHAVCSPCTLITRHSTIHEVTGRQ